MEELSSLRNWAFIISFIMYMANAVPANSKAKGAEFFNITVHIYSGRENPTWTLNVDSPVIKVQNVIKKLRELDMHQHGGHAGHNAQADQTAVTEKLVKSGYSQIEIDHFFGNGNSHKMVIDRCSDPFLEWDILSKTSPLETMTNGTLSSLFRILQPCAVEHMKIQKAKKAAGSAQQATKTTTRQHKHNDGHAH